MPARWRMAHALTAATVAIASFSACAGQPTTVASTIPAAPNTIAPVTHALRSHVTSSAFTWVRTWGPVGEKAVAQCPSGYKVVGGGDSSGDGANIGPGAADVSAQAWVAPISGPKAQSLAQASCLSDSVATGSFYWANGAESNGLASASCNPGFTLISGYGSKTTNGGVNTSWVNGNSYWVSGGADAYAGCLAATGVTLSPKWGSGPGYVFSGCGTGFDIGGAVGNQTYPGPPLQNHVGGSASPSTTGTQGWWADSGSHTSVVVWAACVPT